METALMLVIAGYLSGMGRTRAEFARALGVSDSTVKRRLEGEFTGSPQDGIDAWVDAASRITGVNPMEFWEQALETWRTLGPERIKVSRTSVEALETAGAERLKFLREVAASSLPESEEGRQHEERLAARAERRRKRHQNESGDPSPIRSVRTSVRDE
jgi:transcriptional regulator with XRE-family HTH domain